MSKKEEKDEKEIQGGRQGESKRKKPIHISHIRNWQKIAGPAELPKSTGIYVNTLKSKLESD